MEKRTFAKLRDYVEPAHPMVVRLHDDLVAIYKLIRKKYQDRIDHTFDHVSQKIGFVVTTALPFTFEIEDNHVKGIVVTDGEQLQDTLFEQGLQRALKGIEKEAIPKVADGSYKLYLFWSDALRLKFRTDWMEPAHFGKQWLESAHFTSERVDREKIIPGVREPVHWFDPGISIVADDMVLISAIDDVYPELRLIKIIKRQRETAYKEIVPGVREPVHHRPFETRKVFDKSTDVLAELAEVLRRYGY